MVRDRPSRPSLPASHYERYIGSDEWRRSPARLLELRRAGRLCRVCNRGEPEVRIEVHHRTYARLGRETVSDLCTLCRECHELVTSELRRRRYAASALPLPRDTPRASPLVEFRDGTHRDRGTSHG